MSGYLPAVLYTAGRRYGNRKTKGAMKLRDTIRSLKTSEGKPVKSLEVCGKHTSCVAAARKTLPQTR